MTSLEKERVVFIATAEGKDEESQGFLVITECSREELRAFDRHAGAVVSSEAQLTRREGHFLSTRMYFIVLKIKGEKLLFS